MFLNRWVTQGLGHPVPISTRPQPHVLLPLVDLPPPTHLHLSTHLHPTILEWVALLTLLRLGALLLQEDTTTHPAVLRLAGLNLLRLPVLLQEDITTTNPAVLHPADLILIQPAASHQAGTITLQPQQQSTEEFQSLSR